MTTTLRYRDILEANNGIQSVGEDTYWLCVTRTVQESKLFPVPAYMLLSYLMAFYRYPTLLRKIEARMSAEEIGDRARSMGGKLGCLPAWGLPAFYLLGREMLINFGLLAPEDAAEDVVYVMDFWRRFKLAQQREDGHLNAREFGQRAQPLPERRVQVFHADLIRCGADDRLQKASQSFVAAVSQYGFLASCECRVTINNSGPYKLGDGRELLIRDFSDLGEGDYPWLDGVAADIPYNNLTVVIEATGCEFYLLDDWGSFESRPEFTAQHVTGVALYTSDALTDGYVPVAMGSAEELATMFERLTETLRDVTAKLWKRIAGWSRDQMMDAGALVYFAIIKDFAHLAGVYEVDDWMTVDNRADRFRPLFNDEFGRDFLGELVGAISLPSQQISDYSMMQHNNRPVRYLSLIPYSILSRADHQPSSGGMAPGITHHVAKVDRYLTSQGKLSLVDYNARVHAFRPTALQPEYRFICDTTVKYHPDALEVDALYRIEQRASVRLRDKGAGLRRGDIDALRD